MTPASHMERREATWAVKRDGIQVTARIMVARDLRRASGSLEDTLANPDFVADATHVARRDARGGRLAEILEATRPLVPALLAAKRPLDLLQVPHLVSEVEAFISIATLFFVPWADGDCSRRITLLQRAAGALRTAKVDLNASGDDGAVAGTDFDNRAAFAPVASFYDAVLTDIERRAQRRRARIHEATGSGNPEKRREIALDAALHRYTEALTDWMRSVLGW